MRSTFVSLVLVGAALATVLSSSTANAKPKVSLDADAAFPVTPKHLDAGFGGGLRLGYELDLVALSLTPEVGASYTVVGNDDLKAKMLRGFVGGRLMFGELVKPGVYAHLGYSNVSYSDAAGIDVPSRGAPTYDAGFALDLTFIPKIDLGAQVGYVLVGGSSGYAAIGWVNAGVHVAFVF